MIASLICTYYLFFVMYPNGTTIVNANYFNEYFFECVLLITSIPGLIIIIKRFYYSIYKYGEVKI
jgi:hypothetical protein